MQKNLEDVITFENAIKIGIGYGIGRLLVVRLDRLGVELTHAAFKKYRNKNK